MTLGPPLHSLFIFMAVSEDPIPLVPVKVEDGHMRKSCWGRSFCTVVIWDLLGLSWHVGYSLYTSGAHCSYKPDGLVDGQTFLDDKRRSKVVFLSGVL